MPPRSIPLQSIKSISQRSLLRYWARSAGRRPFPPITQFTPELRLHDSRQLVFWNIEESDTGRIFRALAHGQYLTEAFHERWDGKTLDEVAPPSVRSYAVETANWCVDSGCPVYTILATVNGNGERVDCERMLLPFGQAGHVSQMLASLQLSSVEGRFSRSTALSEFRQHAELVLAGTIDVAELRRVQPPGPAEVAQAQASESV